MNQKKIKITISGCSPAVFVGEVLYEGLGENGAGQKIRELKVRGHWENKTQEMTITFSTPICYWEHLDGVSNG